MKQAKGAAHEEAWVWKKPAALPPTPGESDNADVLGYRWPVGYTWETRCVSGQGPPPEDVC